MNGNKYTSKCNYSSLEDATEGLNTLMSQCLSDAESDNPCCEIEGWEFNIVTVHRELGTAAWRATCTLTTSEPIAEK